MLPRDGELVVERERNRPDAGGVADEALDVAAALDIPEADAAIRRGDDGAAAVVGEGHLVGRTVA